MGKRKWYELKSNPNNFNMRETFGRLYNFKFKGDKTFFQRKTSKEAERSERKTWTEVYSSSIGNMNKPSHRARRTNEKIKGRRKGLEYRISYVGDDYSFQKRTKKKRRI
tara:strand:- start:1568 stop:1894 length:327 start_codon:yes stop_codon:yes gene_type:complete